MRVDLRDLRRRDPRVLQLERRSPLASQHHTPLAFDPHRAGTPLDRLRGILHLEDVTVGRENTQCSVVAAHLAWLGRWPLLGSVAKRSGGPFISVGGAGAAHRVRAAASAHLKLARHRYGVPQQQQHHTAPMDDPAVVDIGDDECAERQERAGLRSLVRFAGSCAVNLVLPFVNGLMLGFGELLAHELAWRNNLFDRVRNRGYRVYPPRRVQAAREKTFL
ncbi:hypothetical protein HG536_0F03460 [Torulaspora globosa]|uniref:Mitochondrial import protein 1 n=1 Tax=Torulaspora globosa TaxID=48254 RepID=A0A7G3ZKI5_9SACH|nr:uncharacterized protein HG536_0F03460 [Torulaspora globosa]QLL34021.1 hypothetical protein HG536_0F03460 [Torulaspora globosa]